jgi:hypothetical protein
MTLPRGYRGKTLGEGLASMVSSAFLQRQAEILVAMSRATFDLTIAGRLRRMAAELQAKAAELDDEVKLSVAGAAGLKQSARI